ncbi:MAG TPA: 4-(cytidine 5'-diphospho)-2-C-methyl-D-erythritol kinase [Candidatus Limnocylindria bacterium]
MTAGTTALALDAPAKVNLDLRVVGRRDDGQHLLESTIVLLELSDRLLLLPGCSGLRVDGAVAGDVPIDTGNLAWRGLVAGLGREPELTCLTLEKRIPAAAGLGGGSSDAAAAWRLGRAWRGAPEEPAAGEVEALAAIGADVPFFASGAAAARVEGIGERVTTLPARELAIVLVHPALGLRTRDVFGELREEEWGSGTNDLLAPATRLCPPIAELFALVVAAGGEPRLTGSGPTVFAATEDPERARDIGSRLARAGQRVTVTRSRRAGASIARSTEEK